MGIKIEQAQFLDCKNRSTAITAVLFFVSIEILRVLPPGVYIYILRHDFAKEVVRMLHILIPRARSILFSPAPITSGGKIP